MNTETSGRAMGWGMLMGLLAAPFVMPLIGSVALPRLHPLGEMRRGDAFGWTMIYTVLVSIYGAPGGLVFGGLCGLLIDSLMSSGRLVVRGAVWASGALVGSFCGAVNGTGISLLLCLSSRNSLQEVPLQFVFAFGVLGALIGLAAGLATAIKVWRLHNWTRLEDDTYESTAFSVPRHPAERY